MADGPPGPGEVVAAISQAGKHHRFQCFRYRPKKEMVAQYSIYWLVPPEDHTNNT